MRPATRPRRKGEARLLAIDSRHERFAEIPLAELPALFAPGDVVVVNDAATLPASLPGRVRKTGAPIELRLVAPVRGPRWRAVALGAGDFRTPTEDRPPPALAPDGAEIIDFFAAGKCALSARISDHSPLSPHLVEVTFDASGPALWAALYALGRPIQYAHMGEALRLSAVQTAYASRPWAAEMPSAGRPLSWALLLALRRRGIAIAALTHAAGLSATGDSAIDAALPLAERFSIPAATAAAIHRARARGGRVIAVGTTVVRALEGSRANAPGGQIFGHCGETELIIGPGHELVVVDGIISGMHAPGESHYRLLGAFAAGELLEGAIHYADEAGFLAHEMGDLTVIAPDLKIAGDWRYARAALSWARRPAISSGSLMSMTGELSYCS